MVGGDSSSRPDPRERTVKTAGQIVKYSREIYHLDSVEEVANLTLEATPRFVDGHPSAMVAEVRNDELQVLASMLPGATVGGDPGALARRAYETDRVVVCAGADTEIAYTNDEVAVADPAEDDRGGVWIAAPAIYRDEVGESGAVLVLYWSSLERIAEYHVKPVAYFAEHVATAIVNIRSRERLERARNDLAKRKEMVEVYDRLLRHDLGNDLQVIAGFSDAMAARIDEEEDERVQEYAEKIRRTARSAAELIDNVGETVKTLEAEAGSNPEVRDLEPILTGVVEDVRAKFDSLTVEYDAGEFEYRVYTGDLIDSVFENVLSNAAVHNEGEVTVRLFVEEPAPDTLLVRIADDGAGIDEDVRDELFQVGGKDPGSDGNGFGLGLARTLVESYGGAIEVRDSEWGGAEFRIALDRP